MVAISLNAPLALNLKKLLLLNNSSPLCTAVAKTVCSVSLGSFFLYWCSVSKKNRYLKCFALKGKRVISTFGFTVVFVSFFLNFGRSLQVVSPTISSPVCQEQLIEAGKLVDRSVESCIQACLSATEDGELLKQVGL